MKAVILARVSTAEQATEGHSIEAQIMLLKEYCKLKKLDIIKEFKIVESSTKGERKEFKEMLKYISSQNETISLVCHKVDRLQRSFNEYHLLNEPLQKGKLELHFTQSNAVLTKDSTSQEKLMWNMQIVMAQNFTDSISDNVKRSYQKLIKEGKILGPAPIGYINTKNKNGKSTVVFDPDKYILVKRLFHEYATGCYSLEQLSKLSYEWGLTSKKGLKISKNSISDILRNPFYYGVIKLKTYDFEYPHIYETLIDKDAWQKCQVVRQGRSKNYSNTTKQDFIFSGLVRCSNCGCLLSPELKKGKYIYLRPNNKNKCNCKQINENVALNVVQEVLKGFYLPNDYEDKIRKVLKATLESKNVFKAYSVDSLTKKLKTIRSKKDRALELFIDNSITQYEYNKKKRDYTIKEYEIKERLNKFEDADDKFEITVKTLLDIVSKASKLFESSDSLTKRKILKLVFSNLSLKDGNIEYTMNPSFNIVANLGKCEKWLPEPGSNQRPND